MTIAEGEYTETPAKHTFHPTCKMASKYYSIRRAEHPSTRHFAYSSHWQNGAGVFFMVKISLSNESLHAVYSLAGSSISRLRQNSIFMEK
jgi:hypothetical protein